jgi:hypothetical protein
MMSVKNRMPGGSRLVLLWLLALLVSVMVAACSRVTPTDSPAVSAGQQEAPANPAEAALIYAQCIRANGYPEWPDPDAEGRIMLRRDQGMSFNDPRMRAAQEACQALRPPGMGGGVASDPAERMEALLAFAECMRENGVPDWPDPNPDSGGMVVMGAESGIDPSAPGFQAAMRACAGHMQGGIMMGGTDQ